MEIQTSNNYVDWTSLSVVELTGMTFSSRSIPAGLENDIDIATLNFTTPVWLTTPAKVKKLGVITKIITSIFTEPSGSIEAGDFAHSDEIDYFSGTTPASVNVTTLGNLSLLVLNNTAKLLPPSSDGTKFTNWMAILEAYPGKFTANLSQIRMTKADGNEMIAYISLNPTDDFAMAMSIDSDSVDFDTQLISAGYPNGYGRIDAIINPQTYNPATTTVGTRYLILEDINAVPEFGNGDYSGPIAWKDANGDDHQYYSNNIIEWDGTQWQTIFSSQTTTDATYITNSYTGVQYKWDGESWMKNFEGIYDPGKWRLIL